MKVVITGTACGMGLAIAQKFVDMGHEVHGIDILPMKDSIFHCPGYSHYIANVADFDSLPDIDGVNILVNNAGVQGSGMDIDVNLKGLMNSTKKYALNNAMLRAVLNQASASAHLGTEYDEYVASKGGVIAYTKWTAKEVAKYGAVCNSLSFGGVSTEINKPVMENQELWNQIMDLTPLKRWTSVEEVAEWVYFMTVVYRSCSGSDIIIDNLESLNGVFVWE
jgi:NAD(P)-dependent dehydrogenase (short-subunit alcohol dehydrogenase family)